MSRLAVAIAGALVLLTAFGCGADERERGGGQAPGDACSAEDASEDAHICSGARSLECKDDEAGGFVWGIGADCAASGEVCVAGECEAPVAGNNGGSCPDLAGTWTFSDHCEAALVGEDYEVTQEGCTLTVSAPGWTGTVEPGGNVTLSGPAGGGAIMTCTGQATTNRLAASCSPPCEVVLER
jgi:hypothetical protein